MAEPDTSDTAREKTNGRTQSAPAGELRGRIDQVGAILAKGLDLAEAGLSLGVTIVSRVGAVTQEKLLDRLMTAGATVAATAGAGAQAPAPAPPDAAPSGGFGITNRLPLTPGARVRISFSINNDSATAQKKVVLSLEGFSGDATGRNIDPKDFAIKPAKKLIEPMDFEKFVLEGAVPADAPPDIYRGYVAVASDNELRIPVWLAITAM